MGLEDEFLAVSHAYTQREILFLIGETGPSSYKINGDGCCCQFHKQENLQGEFLELCKLEDGIPMNFTNLPSNWRENIRSLRLIHSIPSEIQPDVFVILRGCN